VKRRDATQEEREEFKKAFGSLRPAVVGKRAGDDPGAKSRPNSASPRSANHSEVRLRRGLLEPDDRLDLHGLSEAEAHRSLLGFLRAARARKFRLVLVVTGRGTRKADLKEPAFDLGLDRAPRGAIRLATPRWLSEPAFRNLVASFRSAHRRHGGEGALYIVLRSRRP